MIFDLSCMCLRKQRRSRRLSSCKRPGLDSPGHAGSSGLIAIRYRLGIAGLSLWRTWRRLIFILMLSSPRLRARRFRPPCTICGPARLAVRSYCWGRGRNNFGRRLHSFRRHLRPFRRHLRRAFLCHDGGRASHKGGGDENHAGILHCVSLHVGFDIQETLGSGPLFPELCLAGAPNTNGM